MSAIASSLKTLSSFIQNHEVSFSNAVLVLFTIGSEQIFRINAFQCPCTQPAAYNYSLIFFIVPGLVLAVLGIVVSNLTWRVFHGCFHREHNNGCFKSLGYGCIIISRATVVPCAWLFITFVDGNYYACMNSELPCEKGNDEYKEKMAVSQNIAWIALAAVVSFVFIVICCIRCCDSVTYVRSKYLSAYREAEQKLLESELQEKANQLAKQNVEDFLKNGVKEEKDWDQISKAPDHTISCNCKCDRKNKVFLSPLHKWITRGAKPQQRETEGLPERVSISNV